MEKLMFNTVFLEEDIQYNSYALNILNKIKYKDLILIKSYSDIWGRTKKPYLQKRETLNLFIAKKKGELVKPAPDAYGLGKENHYYYVHAYNCIYECQYCYLQGYFHTPDLVLFVNHEDIIAEMTTLIAKPENKDAWFHAGEYSDSLALSHMTGELATYFDFFKKHPSNKLELRTKSVNIKPLLSLEPADNIYISFTLSARESAKQFDLKCPELKHRLNAIKKLVEHGYQIGIHLDPLIYQDDFKEQYQQLLQQLSSILPDKQLGYISIGVVRFTKDVFREVEANYPNSTMLKQDFIKSFDGKVRYNLPMRMWMMNTVKQFCLAVNYQAQKIYLCMEES